MRFSVNRANQCKQCSNQRAAMAGFCTRPVSDFGLRRCPRVQGMAGAGAALAAMMDFSQRRCNVMAIVLSLVLRCFRFGDNLTNHCGTVLAGVKILRLFEGAWVFNCGGGTKSGSFRKLEQYHLCGNILAHTVTNGRQGLPSFRRSYRRMTDINRP
jgi:hypothetical protein